MVRKVLGAALLGVALLAAGTAQAQSWGDPGHRWNGWGGHDGYRGGYGGNGYRGFGGGQVCSGQRGQALQGKLRHEWNEGELDPRTAQRIERELYKLQYKAREECAERDWGAVQGIAQRYDRIESWMEREAHGRNGW
jgi:hypothetical protein